MSKYSKMDAAHSNIEEEEEDDDKERELLSAIPCDEQDSFKDLKKSSSHIVHVHKPIPIMKHRESVHRPLERAYFQFEVYIIGLLRRVFTVLNFLHEIICIVEA